MQLNILDELQTKHLSLESRLRVVEHERIEVSQATGRILARPILNFRDSPALDISAMDGYAVVAEDTFGAGRFEPKVLRCIEKVYTGQVPERALSRGECIEIAHKSSSRATYAQGSLRASRFLAQRGPGLFDMNDVLGIA